jgi:hypothetical protein
MRNILLSLLLTSIAAGCAMQPALTRREVDIAVPVPTPTPLIPERPHLAISDLADNAPADAVIGAYASSLRACVTYSAQLNTILDSYGSGH